MKTYAKIIIHNNYFVRLKKWINLVLFFECSNNNPQSNVRFVFKKCM